MTVTIEIPNTIYRKLELIASKGAHSPSDVVGEFINEKINDTFESWWAERYHPNVTAEEAIDILRQGSGSAPADEFDKW